MLFIVVLGHNMSRNMATDMMRKQLEVATGIYNEHPDAVIVLTGADVGNVGCTEALYMKNILVHEKRIPQDAIICDNYATRTVQNIINSMYIMKNYKYREVIYITSAFHCKRVRKIVECLGIGGSEVIGVDDRDVLYGEDRKRMERHEKVHISRVMDELIEEGHLP